VYLVFPVIVFICHISHSSREMMSVMLSRRTLASFP